MSSSTGSSADLRLLALGSEQFVSLATFRASGAPVPTPVWVARDAEHLVVITPANSGKVRRLGRNPRVTLTPCDRGGRPEPGVSAVEAVASVHEDAATLARTQALLAQKYGLAYRLLMGVEKLVPKRRDTTRVTLHIHPPGAGPTGSPADRTG